MVVATTAASAASLGRSLQCRWLVYEMEMGTSDVGVDAHVDSDVDGEVDDEPWLIAVVLPKTIDFLGPVAELEVMHEGK